MNKDAFENKLAGIQVAEPDDLDLEMLDAADSESNTSTITYEQLKDEMEYSGKISLRLPRTLHKELSEGAKREGVSLNQYAVYKLAK